MTIYEIAKQALAHLEYGTDEDSMSQFIDRFTIYINDGARIIGQHLKMEAVDELILHNDRFNISQLNKESVTKVVEVFRGHRRYPFVQGDSAGDSLGDFKVLHDYDHPPFYGDANNDGKATAADTAALAGYLNGINIFDDQCLINSDLDGDGRVTAADLTLLTDNFYDWIAGQKGLFPVESMASSGPVVNIRFRYMPNYVSAINEAPDIPAVFHPILWMYVVHCHHNSRATASDYDRTKWLQEFERQRKILTRAYGALDTYQIKNKPWQTGEM